MSKISQGIFIILLGPSGAGKGTIMSLLQDDPEAEYHFARSTTTRDPRPGEEAAGQYLFWEREDFEQGIEDDAFLEWAQVHNDNYYGTLRAEIEPHVESGEIVIKEMDVQGVEQVWQRMDADRVLTFFIMPPSLEILRQRIVDRAPITDDELAARMASIEHEMEYAQRCDHQLMSHDGEQELAATEIKNIVAKQLQKRHTEPCV